MMTIDVKVNGKIVGAYTVTDTGIHQGNERCGSDKGCVRAHYYEVDALVGGKKATAVVQHTPTGSPASSLAAKALMLTYPKL